ncbi:MAG TPA: glycyl-radical enzyme activating protein [Anaerolinea thermolimosa]|uniref:Glycyl-radical enzyme activating protein n=1 Tax=Anaerolinea thermolimosa TaxID=229919 RepID=A0A3D1JFG0_9CHLR|nr:glycyl-radical enzyme activating protein [Anaerolinea thermolimosa]GAP08219.1 glycyl-radical enzyme activating protein family [Anaerolinea thermolimosa]HCE16498.1 glycyl-radical enzyme activating protein [Anaerolinea thermolimosa]
MPQITGLVFNVQRFSLHDGPGIRTTVFLKGCPLHCFWCHNPEGLHPWPEVQFFPGRCVGCGECEKVCPQGAQQFLADGSRFYDRVRCAQCGTCVEVCYAESLRLVGKRVTLEETLLEVLADRAFYETSGGGVTLSGGEPFLQPVFTRALLAACKVEGLHTAVETSACCPWEAMEAVLPVTDLWMVDIKHLDAEKHRQATGVSNRQILENIRRLAETDRPLTLRVPVVPGVNDTPAEIGAIAEFVHGLNLRRGPAAPPISLELLPFHRLAGEKYRSLGMDDAAAELTPPSAEQMASLVAAASLLSIRVTSR